MNLNSLRQQIVDHNLSLLPDKVIEHFGWCIQTVEADSIPGDVIETGVWRGGACIYAHHVLKALGSKRRLWLCDSFAGLPPPKPSRFPADAADTHHLMPIFAVTQKQVEDNFRRFGGFDSSVMFVKGWFCDTIPTLPIEQIAVLRLDGDMYESTFIVLEHLYPKLSVNGFCIIDDFGHPAAKQAVMDYRATNQIHDPIIPIQHPGKYPHSFWRKSGLR
jgi:O-methyltransferase